MISRSGKSVKRKEKIKPSFRKSTGIIFRSEEKEKETSSVGVSSTDCANCERELKLSEIAQGLCAKCHREINGNRGGFND